jgi:hypothetical protein
MNSKKDRLKEQVLKVLAVHFREEFEPKELNDCASEILDIFCPIKNLTEQQKMVGALAGVMNGNSTLMGARLGRFASQMVKVGATSVKVMEMYQRGGWWWHYHWKGLKGEYPNEQDIRATWDHWDIPEVQTKPYDGPTMADLRKQGYS